MARLSSKEVDTIAKVLIDLQTKGQGVFGAAEKLKSASSADLAKLEGEFNDALGQWKNEAAKLEAFGAEGGFSVADFLEQVGEGMVSGQKKLDDSTKRYLAKLPEHAPPTTFRIPKLKAELHFAMETSVKKKLNAFVYGRSREDRASQQHKVDFEIVAAPPPPAMLAQIAGIPLTGAVVTNLLERESVLARIEPLRDMSSSGDSALKGAVAAAKKILENRPSSPRDRTIVLGGKNDYILVLPLKTGSKLHMLSLSKSESSPPVASGAEVVIEGGEILVDWLREVSLKQAEFLAARRPDDA